MKAIFKRELRSYFTSMPGYVFLSIFLLLSGFLFYLMNIKTLLSSMKYMFAILNNWALFLLPLLTMRLFTEDKRQKTDQLLLTAPVSVKEIVFGKFLAALCVFLTGIAITLLFPVILSFLGSLPVAETISCYVGFILLCALILSIGAFMSSITENQIVAAVATYGVLILTLLIGQLASYISNETIVKVLLWLSPIQRFNDFTLGILNIESVVYYISLTGLFLFFTVTAFERRRLR
jgi:ABC-2 type transport system permease protein